MSAPLYALDIETDTTVDAPGAGLDPEVCGVLSAAVASARGTFVVDDTDEVRLLRTLDAWLDASEPGVLVTWNGAAFDLPFLHRRGQLLGVDLPVTVAPDPSRAPKYPPVGSIGGCVRARWGAHDHADIAFAWRAHAERLGVPWSLKPVARSVGLDPVEVDRARVGDLTTAERCAYNVSDVDATLALGELLGDRLDEFLDRLAS